MKDEDKPVGIALEAGGPGDIVRVQIGGGPLPIDAVGRDVDPYRWTPAKDTRPRHFYCKSLVEFASASVKPDGPAACGDIAEGLNRLSASLRAFRAGSEDVRAAWAALKSQQVGILRMALAWDAVRRHPGRSQLASPGTRKKRGGGHRGGPATKGRR